MKKHLLPFFALLFLISCEKESTTELQTEESYYESAATSTRNANKVRLCHNGHMINVSKNALNAHLNHGDDVEFGQLGTYNITYRLGNNVYNHQGDITQSDNGSFSGAGQSLTTGQQWTLTGTIDNDGNYSFTLHYTNSSYTATATGTFACDGSGYNGTWSDSSNQSGTWSGTYQ